MDITPIYELKTRLRAAMIAGTNLISDDFRLKKAAENLAPLAASSPVFAKISAMTQKLLEEKSPESLLDTITLVDSVLTTLGTTEVKGELESLPDNGISSISVTAPYSQLSTVIDALTMPGSGQFNRIVEIRENTPEIFRDYRIKPALIKGLDASYSELANTVEDIIKDIGKEMLPLVKKGFDPKGKKEAVRRVHIIEELCGAEENDFYLEQLENSESDVRKALIFALRHDEKNIDKLIELTKTEKGKLKTAALAALASFDCEKSVDFFEEYAKKKPVDVLKIISRKSSKWTSELTARLIDTLLVDDKGNKITLSQSAGKDVKLNTKATFFDLNSALWGKWGADIEKIYREYEDKQWYKQMSVRLGDSIIVTKDKSLMALAIELNNKPKLKGDYDYAETVARFLSDEDCTEWLKNKVHELKLKSAVNKKAVFESDITRVLKLMRYDNGGYVMRIAYFNDVTGDASDQWQFMSVPVAQDMKAVTDILLKNPSEYYNAVIAEWIDPNDKELCKKIGEYFCDNIRHFNGTGASDINLWCRCIGKCGLSNVKDLAADYFKNKGITYTSWVKTIVAAVPGDDKYRLEEARSIIEAAQKKKYDGFDIAEFEEWANSSYIHV